MRGAPPTTRFPDGGYLDNGSSGYTPRFWEEVVRQQFISSAAFLIEEMHVDGLRVDLTQAIHRDNALHADGRSHRQRQYLRAEAPAGVEPHAADDPPDGDADRGGPHRLGRRDGTAGPRRVGI